MNNELWVDFIEWMSDNFISIHQAHLRENLFVNEFCKEHKITNDEKIELIKWAKESFQEYIDGEKQARINESLYEITKDF